MKIIKAFISSLLIVVYLSCATFGENQTYSNRKYSLDFSRESLRAFSVSTYVNRVAKNLAKHETRDKFGFPTVEVNVLKTSRIQGDSIFDMSSINITRGMLNAMANEAELACLIGHEIGHKVLHRNKKYQKGTSLKDIFIPDDIAQAKWSQHREQEADEYGAALCQGSGYDPYAFLNFFERLSRFQTKDLFAAFAELTATHKDFRNRATSLRKFLERSGFQPDKGVVKKGEYIRSLAALKNIHTGDTINEILPGGSLKVIEKLDEISRELRDYA